MLQARRQGKRFFFEKKNQKTFTRLSRFSQERSGPTNKSLLLLFFRKEVLPYFFDFSIYRAGPA
jgi:hypothetical protein